MLPSEAVTLGCKKNVRRAIEILKGIAVDPSEKFNPVANAKIGYETLEIAL